MVGDDEHSPSTTTCGSGGVARDRGMALYRNEPIEHIVDMLDLALPDKKDTLVAKSAIAQGPVDG